jgi:hypothetical protein
VWRAVDTRLDRDVAVKVLPERLALDREALARFDRAARADVMSAILNDDPPPIPALDGGSGPAAAAEPIGAFERSIEVSQGASVSLGDGARSLPQLPPAAGQRSLSRRAQVRRGAAANGAGGSAGRSRRRAMKMKRRREKGVR